MKRGILDASYEQQGSTNMADPEYFSKEARRAFGFGRFEHPVYTYKENWKRLFFKVYGKKGSQDDKKNSKKSPFIIDSYMRVAYELASLRDDTGKGLYIPDKDIRAQLGVADILYPLIPLSVACIALSRAMSIKCANLATDAQSGYSLLLKFCQYVFNVLLTIPLTAVALLTTLIWDVAKAVIAVVVATIGAIPLAFRKEADPTDYIRVEEEWGKEKKVINKNVEQINPPPDEKMSAWMSLDVSNPRMSQDRSKMRNSFSGLQEDGAATPIGHGSPRIGKE